MYKGEIIKELLSESGRNAKELLEAMGLNPKYNSIQRFINGNPTAETLERIADFFQCPIDVFFERGNVAGQKPLQEIHLEGKKNHFERFSFVVNSNEYMQEKIETLEKQNKELKEDKIFLQRLLSDSVRGRYRDATT